LLYKQTDQQTLLLWIQVSPSARSGARVQTPAIKGLLSLDISRETKIASERGDGARSLRKHTQRFSRRAQTSPVHVALAGSGHPLQQGVWPSLEKGVRAREASREGTRGYSQESQKFRKLKQFL